MFLKWPTLQANIPELMVTLQRECFYPDPHPNLPVWYLLP
jgi:hypothetical protein